MSKSPTFKEQFIVRKFLCKEMTLKSAAKALSISTTAFAFLTTTCCQYWVEKYKDKVNKTIDK